MRRFSGAVKDGLWAETSLPIRELKMFASTRVGTKKTPEVREMARIELNILEIGFIKQTKIPRDFLPSPYKIRLELQATYVNSSANKGSHDGYDRFRNFGQFTIQLLFGMLIRVAY